MLLSSNQKKPTIGLTPLIDVVFILLIFFMLVMQFQQFQKDTVHLSERDEQGLIDNNIAQVKVIDEKNCFYENSNVQCNYVIDVILEDEISSISLSYQKDARLSDIMKWHDVFSERFQSVSLAVSVTSKGNSDAK